MFPPVPAGGLPPALPPVPGLWLSLWLSWGLASSLVLAGAAAIPLSTSLAWVLLALAWGLVGSLRPYLSLKGPPRSWLSIERHLFRFYLLILNSA